MTIEKTQPLPPTGSAYPWADVKPGQYICHWPDGDNRNPLPVEILDGQGDFAGQLMYRWFPHTIPGRLMYNMPKCCLLTPNNSGHLRTTAGRT
jgi:hypothetical protein